MTDKEYVERIKLSAQAYMDFIRGDIAGEAARDAVFRWDHIKKNISPHTVIEMCECWLEQNEVKDEG